MTCIVIDDEVHAISELSDLIRITPSLSLLNTFTDAKHAISYLQTVKYVDVIFSDINMPSVNGLAAGNIFNKHCRFLIYVTGYKEFALDAFTVQAAGYLLKPVSYPSFMVQMERINSQYEASPKTSGADKFIFIKGSLKNSFIKLEYLSIMYIIASLNYVVVHSSKGSHMTYSSLKNIETKIGNMNQFIRINKSVIISIEHVDKVNGNMVVMSDKRIHEIGTKFKDIFHDFLQKKTINL